MITLPQASIAYGIMGRVRSLKAHFPGKYNPSCKGEKCFVCDLLALHVVDQLDTDLAFPDASHAIDDISLLLFCLGFLEGSFNSLKLIFTTEEIPIQWWGVAMSELPPLECGRQRGILNEYTLRDEILVASFEVTKVLRGRLHFLITRCFFFSKRAFRDCRKMGERCRQLGKLEIRKVAAVSRQQAALSEERGGISMPSHLARALLCDSNLWSALQLLKRAFCRPA